MNFDKKDKVEILENALSWIVVLAMFLYGGGKIVQFEGASEINKTVSQMTGMELMWAFYGFSKPFAITLGFFEVLGGILMLIRKTRVIGCLLTTTILVNVIIQDLYFGVLFAALKAAIFYQLLILLILWINRERLIHGFKVLLKAKNTDDPKTKSFVKLLIAFVVFVVIRITEYCITMML